MTTFAADLRIYEVVHKAFQTDDLKTVTTLVLAESPKAALDKYNAYASTATYRDYPYFWNEVGPDAVSLAEFLR